MLNLQRKAQRKDWSQIFVEKVEESTAARNAERESRPTEIEIPLELQHLKIAKKFIQDMADNRIYSEIRTKKNEFRCRATLENLTPPKKHANWSPSWGSQLLCNICGLPGISDCVTCGKCDIIAHIQCIRFQLQDAGQQRVTNADIYSYDCPNCKESELADQTYYKKLKDHLELERKKEVGARKIARRIIILLERRRLAKKKLAVIRMQANARRLIMRNRYLRSMRALLKLVLFDLHSLPPATIPKGVIILTVVDPFKNSQSLRLDKTCEEALQETFMIAGLSANMTICLTLAKEVDLHDGLKRYFAYGQAQLNLRDIRNFNKQRNFSLNFMDKIKWVPQEFKGEFRFHLMSTYQAFTNAIMNSQLLLSSAAAAAMANPTTTTHTATAAAVSATSPAVAAALAMAATLALAEAGFSMVSSVSTHLPDADGVSGSGESIPTAAAGSGLAAAQSIGRSLSNMSLDSSDAYSVGSILTAKSGSIKQISHNSLSSSGGGGRQGSMKAKSRQQLQQQQNNNVSSSSTPGGANEADANTTNTNFSSSSEGYMRTPLLLGRKCVVRYLPQNPVTSMVTMVFAPPLDVLKRSAELGFKATKNAGSSGAPTYRNSRFWLCLYRMHLLLFQYYGDSSPRLISDISEATAVVGTDLKGRTTNAVLLHHADQQRTWTIEFNNRHEAFRFAFAVNESKRGFVEGRSRYIKPKELTIPDTPIQTLFGFTTNGIY